MAQAGVEKFLEAADDVASSLKSRLGGNIRVKINTHTDPDGIAAGSILARCLNYYDVSFHISFGGPPDSDDLEKFGEQGYDLFVFLDQGAGQFELIEEYLLEADREVVILDHHPGKIQDQGGLIYLNPHNFNLNGSKSVSASGVVYSVVEKLDKKFEPLSQIALIGALGDRQENSSGFSGINQDILERALDKDILTTRSGLKLVGRSSSLVDCLSLSIRPFLLELSGDEEASLKLVEDMGFDPDEILEDLDLEDEERLRNAILERVEVSPTEEFHHSLWGTIYTSKVDQFAGPENLHEYVAMLTSCEKLDREEIGFSALLGDESSKGKGLETLREYQERMIEVLRWLASNRDKIKATSQMRYLDAGDKLKSKLMGEVLSTAIESSLIETDLPILGLAALGGDRLKVSARATQEYAKSGAKIGGVLEEVSNKLGGSGGGHDVAAAARLPRERKDEFLEKVDQLLEETLELRGGDE